MNFDRHTLVLLVRPPDAPELSDAEADALQDAHLAFRADLRDRGYLIGGGPLVDQDDERLRGISVMTVDPETARELCSADPAVRAGRLAVEVMTWMVPAGNVHFENVRAPRSMAEVSAPEPPPPPS
ncbi:YciI family protein [Actinoplanes bogorensis]|uniref:YciI family protein n=1 Tax=Paractinoplanes bogorensis TaxID=1610840 RepID=A0ABS5Z2F4_9ACTN|nr:YciI family protein [Actinoplanes bogorensis]MBU2669879.1 YciI family protein [Actinoplanes bogorensis]